MEANNGHPISCPAIHIILQFCHSAILLFWHLRDVTNLQHKVFRILATLF